jgi:hypothetical protein
VVFTPSSTWDLPSYAANAAQVMAALPSPPSQQCRRSFDSHTMRYLDVEAMMLVVRIVLRRKMIAQAFMDSPLNNAHFIWNSFYSGFELAFN